MELDFQNFRNINQIAFRFAALKPIKKMRVHICIFGEFEFNHGYNTTNAVVHN